MNTNFKLFAGFCLAAMFALPSCEKTPVTEDNKKNPDPDVVVPVVSISADPSFSADNKANVTLTLDQATTVDVVVKLATATVEEGYEALYADFKKEVKIPAGQTSATVPVEADTDGCASGNYQVAIKISEAEKATPASNSIVYISLVYSAVPVVSLYSDPAFSEEGLLKLKLVLDVATDKDVTANLAIADDAPITVNLSSTAVVIPAGKTEAEVTATAQNPSTFGEYKVTFRIASAQNATVGTYSTTTATYDNRQFKFNIDGSFNDWIKNNVPTLTGDGILKTVKYYVDEKDLYVYIEISGARKVCASGTFNTAMDFFIDCDGISNNGYLRGDIFNHTCNWYYETFLGDETGFGKWDGGQYYTETAWGAWTTHDILPADVQGVYDSENDKAQVEARLGRGDFKITGTKVGLGMMIIDNSTYAYLDKLPKNDDLSLLVLDIPAYKE